MRAFHTLRKHTVPPFANEKFLSELPSRRSARVGGCCLIRGRVSCTCSRTLDLQNLAPETSQPKENDARREIIRNHGRTKVVHNTQQEETRARALSMQSSRGLEVESQIVRTRTRYGARRQSSLAATLPGDMLNESGKCAERNSRKNKV